MSETDLTRTSTTPASNSPKPPPAHDAPASAKTAPGDERNTGLMAGKGMSNDAMTGFQGIDSRYIISLTKILIRLGWIYPTKMIYVAAPQRNATETTPTRLTGCAPSGLPRDGCRLCHLPGEANQMQNRFSESYHISTVAAPIPAIMCNPQAGGLAWRSWRVASLGSPGFLFHRGGIRDVTYSGTVIGGGTSENGK